jgi:hypothetical protein
MSDEIVIVKTTSEYLAEPVENSGIIFSDTFIHIDRLSH